MCFFQETIWEDTRLNWISILLKNMNWIDKFLQFSNTIRLPNFCIFSWQRTYSLYHPIMRNITLFVVLLWEHIHRARLRLWQIWRDCHSWGISKNTLVQLVMTPMMRMVVNDDEEEDDDNWWWIQSLCFQSIGSPEGWGGGKKKERKKGTRQKREEVLYILKHLVDTPVVIMNHKPGEILFTISLRMGIGVCGC